MRKGLVILSLVGVFVFFILYLKFPEIETLFSLYTFGSLWVTLGILSSEETIKKYEKILPSNNIETIRKELPEQVTERMSAWYLLLEKVRTGITELFEEENYFLDREKGELVAIKDFPLLFIQIGDVILCVEYFNYNPVTKEVILEKHDVIWNGHRDEGQRMREEMRREMILAREKKKVPLWVG